MSEQVQQATGLLLVVSGPSGVGKTSIIHAVESRLNGTFSVSATTRPRTEDEVDGRDYFFLSEEAFKDKLDANSFLEHAQVFGKHWYGTLREPVDATLDRNELMLLDIDVQGALQVRSSMPSAMMIFILPPSDDELLRRLRSRGREDESVIQRRYAEAKSEIDLATSSGAYDRMIINDSLERAIDEVCDQVARRLAGQ